MTGLEPATSGVTGRRSNQLSYTRMRAGRPDLRRRVQEVPAGIVSTADCAGGAAAVVSPRFLVSFPAERRAHFAPHKALFETVEWVV